jgi:hypothetical protein
LQSLLLSDRLQHQLSLLSVDAERNEWKHGRQIDMDRNHSGADYFLTVDASDFDRNRAQGITTQLDPLLEATCLVVVLHRLVGLEEIHPHDVVPRASLHLDDDFRTDGNDVAVLRRDNLDCTGRTVHTHQECNYSHAEDGRFLKGMHKK